MKRTWLGVIWCACAACLPALAAPQAAPSAVTVKRFKNVPVEMATGELVQKEPVDLALKSRGMALEITRNYRSQREASGPFGYGWSWSHADHLEFPGDLVINYVSPDTTIPVYPDVLYTSAYARVCLSSPTWGQGDKATGAPDAIGGYANVAHYYGAIGSLQPLVVGGWNFQAPPGTSTIVQVDLTSIGATAYDDDHPQYGVTMKLSAGGSNSVSWGHRAYDFDYVAITSDRASWTWADVNTVQARLALDSYRQNIPMDVIVDTFHLGVTYTRNASGEVKYLPGTTVELKRAGDQYLILHKDGIKALFASDGRLLRKEDPAGNAIVFSYDTVGRMVRVSDALNQSLTFQYDSTLPGAKVTNVVDHLGRSVAYEYDGDNLAGFTDLMGRKTQYDYSSAQTNSVLQHNLVRRVDPDGHAVRIVYYATNAVADRVQSYFDGETTLLASNEVRYLYVKGTTYSWMPGMGSVQGVVYTVSNDISQVYIRPGEPTLRESDGVNLLAGHSAQRIASLAATAQWQNASAVLDDPDGVSAFNPAMDTNGYLDVSGWECSVDSGITNDIVSVTVGVLGSSTNLVRLSALGLASTNWSASSNTWVLLDVTADKSKWAWSDVSNLVVRVSLPAEATNFAAVSIDAFTVKVKYRQFDPGQDVHDRFYFYDVAHNMVSAVRGGAAHQFAYDDRNNLVSWTDPEGAVWRYEYDPALDKRTRSTDPRGNVTKSDYNASGQLVKITTPDGGVTTVEYDQYGNKISQTDPLGNREAYTYDTNGVFLVKQRDANGNETLMDYDAFGNCLRVRAPDGSARHYRYNAVGQKVWEKDEAGTEATVLYDGRGLVTNMAAAAGTRDEASISRRYDGRGLLVETLDALGHSSTTGYDCVGNPSVQNDRMGASVVTLYDLYDRPELVFDPAYHYTECVYDALDNVATNIDRRGGMTIIQYDRDSRPILTIDKGGNAISTTYDGNGNKLSETFCVRGYPGCPDSDVPEPLTVAYSYDSMNRLTNKVVGVGRKDARSSSTSYDLAGRVVRKADALGNYRTMAYDGKGNVTNDCIHDATGEVLGCMVSTYDAKDRLAMKISGWGALATTNRFEYDAAGRKTADRDARGFRTTYAYDRLGRKTSVTDAAGHTSTSEYDRAGNRIRETDRLGLVTECQWDAEGRLIRKETGAGLPDSRVSTYLRDPLGRVVAESDPLGAVAGTLYDEEGNPLVETNTLGYIRRYAYDASGHLTNTVDEAGFQTRQLLDGRGLVCKLIDKLGGVTASAYDVYGRQVKATDPQGAATTFSYDSNDNKVGDVDPRGRVSCYGYDAASRMTNKIVGVGLPQAMAYVTTYDVVGRVVRVVGPDGAVATFDYDAAGNLAAKTDGRGLVTKTCYDELGRPVEVIDPAGASTRSEYDAEGNVVAVCDALGNRTVSTYDVYGLKRSVTDCMGSVTRFDYDRLGRMTNSTDALGYSSSQGWDALGNLIWTRAADGAFTSYAYDRLGRRTNTVDALGFQNSKTVDAAGNVLKAADSRGTPMSYTYDANGRVVSITDPSSNTLCYAYDAAGNKVREVSPAGLVTTYSYDRLGRLVSKTLGAGGKQARTYRYEYDRMGRLSGEYDPLGYATACQYDANGNKTQVTDRRGYTTRMEYDAANRATNTVDALGQAASVQYDPLGRVIRTVNRRGHATVNSYDTLGRLIAVQDPGGGVRRTEYDALGRKIQETAPNGTKTAIAYDPASRVTEKVVGYGLPDSRTYSYTYDLMGRVIRETGPLGGYGIHSYDANGNETAQYAYNPAGTLLRSKSAVYDALNQRIAMTDYRGKVWRSEYDNAGRKVADIDPVGNRVAFEYDIFGGPTATIDQSGNRAETIYDQRGLVVETVNALGQRVRCQYDPNGNRTAVIDDTGRAVVTAYDALNRVSSVNRSMPTVPLDVIRRADVNGDGVVDSRDVDALQGGVP